MLLDKPLLQLEPHELRRIYNSVEIDALKDVLLAVGYIVKYDAMNVEELRGEYQKVTNTTKKEIIKKVGICKKQQ